MDQVLPVIRDIHRLPRDKDVRDDLNLSRRAVYRALGLSPRWRSLSFHVSGDVANWHIAFNSPGDIDCCISGERYATRIAAASAAPACIVAATALYTLIHAARISGVKASPKPLFNAHKRTFLKIL